MRTKSASAYLLFFFVSYYKEIQRKINQRGGEGKKKKQ